MKEYLREREREREREINVCIEGLGFRVIPTV